MGKHFNMGYHLRTRTQLYQTGSTYHLQIHHDSREPRRFMQTAARDNKHIATNTDKAWPLHIEGHTSTKIANILNISKRHVQRILADHKSDSTMQSNRVTLKHNREEYLVHEDCVEMSPHVTFQSQLIPTPVSHKKRPLMSPR